MGLMPLEYKDCLTDSPYYRQKLQAHEKELDKTSQAIKTLTKEVRELVSAAKELSRAQRKLSSSLSAFQFECIGSFQTDDEVVIGSSLKEFAKIVDMVEDERERMLDRSYDQIIAPLENFRKEAIGGAKEGRKKFEKQTVKFYQNQEKYLGLSTKKDGQILQEADASVEMEQRFFAQASLEYAFLLQEVQERKKFEFVETLLSYMYSWLTFYHQGHEVFNDCSPYLRDLQVRLQRTRENFMSTRQEAVQLKNKMLEKNSDPGSMDRMYTRQGYLFLMEKKAFGTTWTKHYCQYQKESRIFTMIPYNQVQQKITSTETLMLKTCVRRMSESIDKRFCFDLTAQDRDKVGVVYTLQALCDEDRKLWMDAMDGKEPSLVQVYGGTGARVGGAQDQTELDACGLAFIMRAIAALEERGLEDQGLYRLVGVSSKVSKLLAQGLDPQRYPKLCLKNPAEWETKTITSAVKQYFRNLPEPLMTYALHAEFITAASECRVARQQDRLAPRVAAIQDLVHRLPNDNRIVLEKLIHHLCKVARLSETNLMTVSNLGVCFGPTLLRPEEETVAAIMDIKFCNIVVEILIEHYDKIFGAPTSSEPASWDTPRLVDSLSHTSTPKGSPPRPSKHSQPVLQTVVTSFNTSEPQSVHFGAGSGGASSASSSVPLLRSDASSNIKQPQQYSQVYGNLSTPQWSHSSSTTSLNSGIGAGNQGHSASQMSLPATSQASHPAGTFDGPTQRHHRAYRSSAAAGAASNTRSDRNDGVVSTSSSSESLCSRSSREQSSSSHLHHHPAALHHHHAQQQPPPLYQQPPKASQQLSSSSGSSPPLPRPRLGTAYPPTFRQHMETNSLSGSSGLPPQSLLSSLPATINNNNNNHLSAANKTTNGASPTVGRVVRTLYACVGENDSELSFEPNVYLTNVHQSREPGWLEGSLDGRKGLVPENYVEFVDDKEVPQLLRQSGVSSLTNTDV